MPITPRIARVRVADVRDDALVYLKSARLAVAAESRQGAEYAETDAIGVCFVGPARVFCLTRSWRLSWRAQRLGVLCSSAAVRRHAVRRAIRRHDRGERARGEAGDA